MLATMTTPDAQGARAAIDRAHDALDEVDAYLGRPPATPTPEPQPVEPVPTPVPTTPEGGLPAPSGFVATVDMTARTATKRWDAVPGAVAYEVHEFIDTPDKTFRARVTTTTRTSGKLTKSKYRYAVRAVDGAGTPGAFSVFAEVELTAAPAAPAKPPVTPAKPVTPAQPTTPSTPATGRHPSDVLDLRNWTIMLPMSKAGTVNNPQNGYMIDTTVVGLFYVDTTSAVVFETPAGGDHSSGSLYPRTEAREMADAKWAKAGWPSSGNNELECDLAIDTSGLTARPRINGMQIHDGGDDVCQIMVNFDDDAIIGKGLGLAHKDGKAWESIDPNYVPGTRFTCRIVARSNELVVIYNGREAARVPKTGTGWYWKWGCYMQTNPSKWGEAPDARGRVRFWRYAQYRDGKLVNGREAETEGDQR